MTTTQVTVPAGARLVLATHNPGKLAELRAILTPLVPGLAPEQIISAAALQAPEPVEDGLTFAANAELKARALATATGLPAVADDSGLCVDVLGGAPGIFSARWCGHHGDDAANLELLLAQLSDIADPHRTARFTCAAVLVTPAAQDTADQAPAVTVVERSMEGRLLTAPLGEGGFGYDPVFVPVQEDRPGAAGRTTAQMSAAEKNAISHRGQAFRDLAPVLADLLA
ncbi:MAG: RdgB/HAM1 family non-canonical purine NTP pyrophosphatase [Actinomyces urogenitalis]|uniref:dITP/XTP pyrophosphatase n=3 Tax=Actinomyces urogenitalis TaxID=103621 RepID=C0W2H8_9ACTO|nr:RdgB/HAM1 family non-canonical purine NTP pyrophosphatase [Actinomyces urogenitalis]ETJ01764.1 MAG: Nucleoside-triphosphatase [Actinomyces urogenitalis DORA_12]EEH67081.1 non-canonical purine NTP pyrophosphatase, RdgB/HAM1 family [Actinomyces urogenitalis DSM 15434]KGF00057.1 nucleoside-triphosphate diphosphatase [Actinomyces urogenitalis S6-C4]MBS5977843.1 RdgB/HAM1 family non-canonical purine NTP pyrophosphatase [Actinomyces urogenitalis]MBS6072530.1 RdgB/HAM1 family non-canonical purine 